MGLIVHFLWRSRRQRTLLSMWHYPLRPRNHLSPSFNVVPMSGVGAHTSIFLLCCSRKKKSPSGFLCTGKNIQGGAAASWGGGVNSDARREADLVYSQARLHSCKERIWCLSIDWIPETSPNLFVTQEREEEKKKEYQSSRMTLNTIFKKYRS